MLASLTGQRMLFNYFRIGGVNGDLNHEFMSRLGDWMSHATEQIEAGLALLNENEIFVRRMRGLGTIDSKAALRMVSSMSSCRCALKTIQRNAPLPSAAVIVMTAVSFVLRRFHHQRRARGGSFIGDRPT